MKRLIKGKMLRWYAIIILLVTVASAMSVSWLDWLKNELFSVGGLSVSVFTLSLLLLALAVFMRAKK